MALDIGGAETHVVELCRELCRRGHAVTVISAGGIYEKDISEAGARHVYAPLNTHRPRDMAMSLGALSALINVEKFDIVHAHARIPAFLCGILRRRYRFNFVTTAHWVFVAKGAKKLLSNWGQRTIAVSEDIKKYLLENYKSVREENITVSVNGIDTERFSPGTQGKHIKQEFAIPETAPVIVNVARLDHTASAPSAAVRALIDAAPVLTQVIRGLRIIIAGGGDAELEFNTRAAQVNESVGYNAVIMTGIRTDIDEILAAGELFVGVSRAALEAMATGLPVILAGGEGYLGLLTKERLDRAIATNFTVRDCPPTDPDTLTADIAAFFENRNSVPYRTRNARLGADGRDIVTRNYSVARMVDDVERVYASLDALPRRVALSGYFGFGNAGDEAIMQAVHRSITASRANTEITVLSKNPKVTREKYGFYAAARFNPFAVAGTIAQSDALVFGGGSLLQDNTSTRSLLYYLSVIRTARFFRKPVMIYANGIGPVNRTSNRNRVKRAVEGAAAVTLRDERSLEELRNMGVTRDDIVITGDPVFTTELPPKNERIEILRSAGLDETREFVAVCVRPWKQTPNLAAELAKLCDAVSSELAVDVVFLPMQASGDAAFSREVASKMKRGGKVPERELSPREILAILAEANFVISMRLHALIFAARAGTPSMGIDVDPKLRVFLETLGMPNLGTPEEFSAEDAIFRAIEVTQKRAELSDALNELAAEQAKLAKKDPIILKKLLDN
jgi:polysaccharide pyruvyl transferase CsaB